MQSHWPVTNRGDAMAAVGKPQVSPQDYATALKAGMTGGNAVAKYKQKIQRLQQAGISPPQLAATPEALQSFLQRVQESVTSGKRAASLMDPQATQLYFQNALTIGAQNYASTGAQKAANKAAGVAQKWAPIWAQASAAAAAVTGPKTQSTALAKVAASMQVMMQAAGRM
jgi:hypothetical protein